MKRLLYILGFLLSLTAYSQPSEVTIVVSGEGATKEEAINQALRSAVEQAYGVFVSANTDIINDDIVKDEIATVTSGNIKSFNELSYIDGKDGMKSISLQAVVAIGKLIEYSKSHGYETEFAGAQFGANLKLAKLNQDNASKAYSHLIEQLKSLHPVMYEYVLDVSNPQADGQVTFRIKCLANENTSTIGELVYNTLMAISLSEDQAKPLLEMGIPLYKYSLAYILPSYTSISEDTSSENRYFYSRLDKQITPLLSPDDHIVIKDNLGNQYTVNTLTYDRFEVMDGHRLLKPKAAGIEFGIAQGINGDVILVVSNKITPNDIVYIFNIPYKIPLDILLSISSFKIDTPSVLSKDYNYEARQIIKHTVKWYDSLEMLSLKYGVSQESIIELNNLSSPILEVGQVLKICIDTL